MGLTFLINNPFTCIESILLLKNDFFHAMLPYWLDYYRTKYICSFSTNNEIEMNVTLMFYSLLYVLLWVLNTLSTYSAKSTLIL